MLVSEKATETTTPPNVKTNLRPLKEVKDLDPKTGLLR